MYLRQCVITGECMVLLIVICLGISTHSISAMRTARFFEAIRLADTKTVHMAIAGGNSVSCVDERGNTPLYRAVMEGNVAVAQVLLAHKADVNQRCKKEYTPLMIAVRNGNGCLENLFFQCRCKC